MEGVLDPIVTVGCPRSGTTVLARIVASSKEVAYLEEQGLVERYLELAAGGTGPETPGWLRACAEEVVKHARLDAFDLIPSGRLTERQGIALRPEDASLVAHLAEGWEALARVAPRRLLPVVLADFCRLAGRPRVLEKTPTHFLNLAALRELLPGARICHVIRDGRDVAASYLHPSFDAPKPPDPLAHIGRLHRTALEVDRRMRAARDPHYLGLRYEELMAEPVATARRVYAFLELPWEEALETRLADVHPLDSKWRALPPEERERIERALAGASPLPIDLPGA